VIELRQGQVAVLGIQKGDKVNCIL
jgi:uncharacterized membrane protein (UPF0127 family)